jgi:hypothetical protein
MAWRQLKWRWKENKRVGKESSHLSSAKLDSFCKEVSRTKIYSIGLEIEDFEKLAIHELCSSYAFAVS